MSASPFERRSDNPNAPDIIPWIYLAERSYLAGNFLSAMLYGITIALFFLCLTSLFNPANRINKSIKRALVIHATAMLSCATVNAAGNLYFMSISYVDNRAFPGNPKLYPGPLMYQYVAYACPSAVVSFVAFFVGQWLADGLLLYRCGLIYSMNYWVIALPCLLYFSTFALGVATMYLTFIPNRDLYANNHLYSVSVAYYSISFSLSVMVTFLIIGRLVVHTRNFQKAMGPQTRVGGLYKAIITTMIESYAIYVANFIGVMATWDSNSPIQLIFAATLAYAQVIAPLLVVLQVSKRTALTSEVASPKNPSSMYFRRPGQSTDVNRTLSDENHIRLMQVRGGVAREPGTADENTITESPVHRGF